MTHDSAFDAAREAGRSVLFRVGLVSLVINLLMLTASVYMMQVFDRVLTSGSLSTLLYLSVIATGALLILGLLDWVRAQTLALTGGWIERKLAPLALRRAVEAGMQGGDYRSEALRDLASVRGVIGGPGMAALFDAPWVPVFLVVIYVLHPVLGHVALAGAVVLFALALANERVSHAALADSGRAGARAMRTADAGLRNAEVIDAMGLMPGFLRRWASDAGHAQHRQLAAANAGAIVSAVAKFFRLFIQVALLGVGAWLVLRHELTSGAMIAGSIILGRALAPVEQAIGSWRQTIQAVEAYRRLRAFLARPPLRPEAMPLPAPEGHLKVENLVYGAPGAKKPIIGGVSFAVRPGEALAIVGPSAAGKSTLARLLVGVLRPNAGAVRLDGADVHLWNREDFGRHVGYLPQDVELFSGAIRDSIARMQQADPAAVVEAARLAHCHDLVLRLERGYDTEIGEDGMRLSGGQRQRIGLARALFGKPRLIVLDEPNANLDAEGEEALNQAIATMKAQGSAVVVIGHRPSILAQVDRVLVLVDGQVEQIGPRAQVLDRLTRRTLQPVPDKPKAAPAAAPAVAIPRSHP